MKLLLLTPYFNPEQMASTHLDNNRYEAFAEAGIKMELYTPIPTRGISEELRAEYKKRKREKSYHEMMSVYRFSMYREGKNPILRALRYVFCFIKQFYYGVKAKDIDLIYLVSTPPIQGVLGAILKNIKKVPFVYNLQDIFPDSLVGTGLVHKDGLIWKIGKVIEKFAYKHADKIIVISEDFKRNIMAKGVPVEKIEVVYNWVDSDIVIPVGKNENPFYKQFNLDRNKFRVVYAGNLGNAQNIDVIIDAAEKLKNNYEIEFVIFGSGGLESNIKRRITERHLNNVKMLPLQPSEKVSFVYSLGDLCIVSCKEGLGGSALPSKTWSILSTARPVLASFDEGELMHLLQDNDCGIFTKAGDVDALVNAIIDISKNPMHCDEMGRKGRKYVIENLSKDVNTQKYVDIIKELGKNNELTI